MAYKQLAEDNRKLKSEKAELSRNFDRECDISNGLYETIKDLNNLKTLDDVKNKDLVESQQRTIDKLESDIRNNKRKAPDDNNRDPRRYSFNNHRE